MTCPELSGLAATVAGQHEHGTATVHSGLSGNAVPETIMEYSEPWPIEPTGHLDPEDVAADYHAARAHHHHHHRRHAA